MEHDIKMDLKVEERGGLIRNRWGRKQKQEGGVVFFP
jgi:hypothetical protein